MRTVFTQDNEIMSILSILAFVVLGSAQDAFLGHLFVTEDPIAVVFFTFLIAFIILQITFLTRKPNSLEQIVRNRSNLLLLNFITALNWISFFVALKYIEPAIVGAISFSIGPAATTAFGPIFRPSGSRPPSSIWVCSIGVLLSSLFLAYCSISGHSAFKTTDTVMASFGVLLALISGIGMTLNTFVSKALSESDLTTQSITAFRFIVLVLLSGVLSISNGSSLSSLSLPVSLSIMAVAVFGIVVPMTLIQIGVKGSEPRLVSALLALTPATTLIFETMDARLALSPLSVVGIVLLCGFAVAEAVSQ